MSSLGPTGKNLSIMIPTFNCASLLKETLQSLKAQYSAIEDAQIEVVDDASTKDDPEAVVQEIFGDRVKFYRQPKNAGIPRNFNTCIERAEREWVHLLHGDDIAILGAYEEFEKCVQLSPDLTAVFARVVDISSDGIWYWIDQETLGPGSRGVYDYSAADWHRNRAQFAGVLIRKRSAMELGNFDTTFSHCADWNLWWRLASQGQCAYSNACVGGYRVFRGNHSSKLMQTASNIKECIKQIDLVVDSLPEKEKHTRSIERLFYSYFYQQALWQTGGYIGNEDAFQANFEVIKLFPQSIRRKKSEIALRYRHLKHRAQHKK